MAPKPVIWKRQRAGSRSDDFSVQSERNDGYRLTTRYPSQPGMRWEAGRLLRRNDIKANGIAHQYLDSRSRIKHHANNLAKNRVIICKKHCGVHHDAGIACPASGIGGA